MQSYIIPRYLQLKKIAFFSCSLTVPFHDSYQLRGLRSKYRSQYGFWKLGVPCNKRYSVTVLIPSPVKILCAPVKYISPNYINSHQRDRAAVGLHFYRAIFTNSYPLHSTYSKKKVNLIIHLFLWVDGDGVISKAVECCAVSRESSEIPYCAPARPHTLLITPWTDSITTTAPWEALAN